MRTGWDAAVSVAEVGAVDLERHRGGYIFAADPVGTRAWRPDVANVWWAKARLAAGSAASVRMHDLRHFQATQLLDAGVPVPTVAARLGHSDGTTTLKIYAHRTHKADQQAADVAGTFSTSAKPGSPVLPFAKSTRLLVTPGW